MESEGLVSLVVPNTGVIVRLLGGSLASCSEPPHSSSPPTATKKSSHSSRKQIFKTSELSNTKRNLDALELQASRSNQIKVPKFRSSSVTNGDQGRQYLEKRLKKNYDVRYITTLRRYLDKFMEASRQSCDQLECPSLQTRLRHHRHEHHSPQTIQKQSWRESTPNKPRSCCRERKHCCPMTAKEPYDGGNEPCRKVPRILQNGHTVKLTSPEGRRGNHSVQTKITFADLGHLTINIDSDAKTRAETAQAEQIVNLKSIDSHNNVSPSNQARFNIECDDDRNVNYYRDSLRDEINKWLLYIPLYPNATPEAKLEKDNTLNNLSESISNLTSEVDNPNYENMVKYEIYECLDGLKICYPGGKRDQALFKEGLCHNLWVTIKDINDKWFGYRSYNDQQKKKRTYYNLYPLRERTCADPTVRCTMDSNPICCNKNKIKKGSCKTKCNKPCKDEIYCEISNWLTKLNLCRQNGSGIMKRTIINIMLYRLNPYLNQPLTEVNKNTLTGKIFEILEDLPIAMNCPSNTGLLTKFADDLANRLLWIRAKSESDKCKKCIVQSSLRCVAHETIETKKEPKSDFLGELRECLTNINLENQRFVEEEIQDIILENIESIRLGNFKEIKSDILILLQESGELTQAEISNVVKLVIDNVQNMVLLDDDDDDVLHGLKMISSIKPYNSTMLSVYESENELTRPYTTLVASNIYIKRQVSEEKPYINKVTKMIKTWIETLPRKTKIYNTDKQIMINELVDEITDQTSLEKISIEQRIEDKAVKINRWLKKFNLAVDNEADRHTAELINKLKEIPTPAKSILSYQECEPACSLQFFVSQGRISLLDAISSWVYEQPSKIYSNDSITYRNIKVKELAAKLKPLVANKRSDKEKSIAIAEWLREMLTNQDRKKINAMAVNLTERLKKENLEETAAVEKEASDEYLNSPDENHKMKFERPIIIQESIVPTYMLKPHEKDADEILKELIMKFIQHNSDVDDSTARGAFAELLETEVQKLSAPSRKELYECFLKSPQEKSSPIRLDSELKYIKDITDWLKNIPIDSAFNARGNKKRTEFCINLAGDIARIENDRIKTHGTKESNNNLETTVGKYMIQLPINPDQHSNIKLMIQQLLNKVISRRKNQATDDENYALTNPHPNLTDFIEDYIRTNGHEIAEDDLELEVCSDRLLKEIIQVICSHDPTAFTKTEVYSRLAEQNVQRDDTVKSFNIKLAYAEEIADWMKNLPLINKIEEGRIHLISELAEKIADTKQKNAFHQKDMQANVELENYVKNWISKLPLDTKKEVVVPILIKQLLNRVEKVNFKNLSIDKVAGEAKKGCCSCGTSEITLQSPSFSPSKSKLTKKFITSLREAISSCCIKSTIKGMPGQSHPASWIVKSIEDWTENLPIEGGDDKDVETVKNKITMKLYQKMGELNVNQRFYKDNALYNDVLSDEIDAQLENLPANMKLKGDKDKMKEVLLETIAESKRKINEKTAGETYKHRLENIIESSMPHPVQLQDHNPGFEIYKNRLASIFILENFDHGNEASKLKYEKRIKREIDKYFQNAQKRNAIQLPKDQIYNELYSILYKVPVPNENSLLQKVEEVKTKCEVDDWFEELPLKTSISVSELLEWDQIRSILAKRLHEMEHDPEPTDKKHKEITKWLVKLPILSGKDLDELANKLEVKLISSAEERKSSPSKKSCNSDKKLKSANYVFKSEDYPSTSANSNKSAKRPIPKKSADLTIETVENWCNQLPIPAYTTSEQEKCKTMKDDLLTKIIIKVSELNSSPETFNDDLLYNHLLGKELDKLLSTLPDSDNIRQSKDARKHQLIEGLSFIKPIIREERARHEYRNELNDTIQNILDRTAGNTAEKIAFNNFRDEVVDDFVEYYHRDDDEGKQFFKKKIHNAMREYLKKTKDDEDKRSIPSDPMIRGNQLLCELAKVPIPSEAAVTDEVQEIRMKKQVGEFFDTLPKDSNEKKELRNQIKTSLAKNLNEIEKTGHCAENDQKMKREITKTLRKLGHELSSQKIDAFIDNLKLNEMARKAPLARKYDSYPMHSNTPDWINNSPSSNSSQIKKKCCNLPNCKRSQKIQEHLDQLQSMDISRQHARRRGCPGSSDQSRQGELPGDYSQFEAEAVRTSSKSHIADSFQHESHSGHQNQISFGRPGDSVRREMTLGGQGQQSLGPDSISEVEWQSTKSLGDGFDLSQGPIITQSPDRSVPPNGSMSPSTSGSQPRGGQTLPGQLWQQERQIPVGSPGGAINQPAVQQSFGPASGSDGQWQSMSSSPGPHHPKVQSFGPPDSRPQNQISFGRPGDSVRREMTLGGQGQQSLGPDSISEVEWQSRKSLGDGFDLSQGPIIPQSPDRSVPPNGSMSPYTSGSQPRGGQPLPGQLWQQERQIPVGSPGGAINQPAVQQSFGPASGSAGQWQSMSSSPGPHHPKVQSFGPPDSRHQNQISFGHPGVGVRREMTLGGQGQQSLGPDSISEVEWQSTKSLGDGFDLSQGPIIPQSPDRSVPPNGSMSPYTSGGQPRGGQPLPSQLWQQEHQIPVGSPGGAFNQPAVQQSFGPASGSDGQWQSMSSSPDPHHPKVQSFGPPGSRPQNQISFGHPGAGVRREMTLGGQGKQSLGSDSISEVEWQSTKSLGDGSDLSRGPIIPQSPFAGPGAGVRQERTLGGQEQQSLGPDSISEVEWQTTKSLGDGFDFRLGPIIPQSPDRSVPPSASMSPYTSGGQPRGCQRLPGQPWQQERQIPVGSPGGAFNQPAFQQSFGPTSGSDGQWQSMSSSPGPNHARVQSFGPPHSRPQNQISFGHPGAGVRREMTLGGQGQQSLGPDSISEVEWQSTKSLGDGYDLSQGPIIPQSPFGGPGAGIRQERTLGGQEQQSLGPDSISEVEWQTTKSLGDGFDLSQGPIIPQSPDRSVPLNESMSPYTSGGQPRGGQPMPGQPWQQERQMPIESPGGAFNQPAVQQSFGPASGNNGQWQSMSSSPGPHHPGVQSFGPLQRYQADQQSFGPASGYNGQWQSILESPGPQQRSMQHYQLGQQSFEPTPGSDEQWQSMLGTPGPHYTGQQLFGSASPQQAQQSFRPKLGYDGQNQSIIESPGPQQSPIHYYQPGQQSFEPTSGNVSEFRIPRQDQSSLGPAGADVIPRGTALGGQAQQYSGSETGSGAQWESMLSKGGPGQGRLQSLGRLHPPQSLETSLSPYASGSQQPVFGQPWQQGSIATGGVQSVGPVSGRSQWESIVSSDGPQQLGFSQGRPQSPGRLHPPQGLEISISPYASGGQQPSFGQIRQQGTVMTGDSGQKSFGPGSGSEGQSILSTSGPEQVRQDLPQSPARQLSPRRLETPLSPYATGGQQGQASSGIQWEPLLSTSVKGQPMVFGSPVPRTMRQFPPKVVSDSMHTSGGSVQEWNTQSSPGPQVIEHRAVAMVHEPPSRTSGPGQSSEVGRASLYPSTPQRQRQTYHDPYISRQYGPGAAWNPQAGGAQASLGQSNVSYQEFQGFLPFNLGN